ncbi:hypothetical protein SRHO_G00039510 [Serrasalmus rhombeus]
MIIDYIAHHKPKYTTQQTSIQRHKATRGANRGEHKHRDGQGAPGKGRGHELDTGPSQSLIRPVAQVTSTSTSDAACPAEVSSAPAVALDVSALRSKIVRAMVSEMRTVMDEHYSNIKTELLDMKSELLHDFATLRSDFAGLKSTVSDIERSLSTCTDDIVALQAKETLEVVRVKVSPSGIPTMRMF